MHFQKIFSLSFILLFSLNIFGCSANIEGCLEDGNCGPAIVVSEFLNTHSSLIKPFIIGCTPRSQVAGLRFVKPETWLDKLTELC